MTKQTAPERIWIKHSNVDKCWHVWGLHEVEDAIEYVRADTRTSSPSDWDEVIKTVRQSVDLEEAIVKLQILSVATRRPEEPKPAVCPTCKSEPVLNGAGNCAHCDWSYIAAPVDQKGEA